MLITINTLYNVLAREFYRANTGFFLVVLGLTFGFMSGVEHLALAQYFISSNIFVLIPACIWILYTFKVIQFNRVETGKAINRFLREIHFISPTKKLIPCLIVIVIELMPVLAYAGFLLLICFREIHFNTLPVLIMVPLAITVLTVANLLLSLRYIPKETVASKLKIFIDRHLVRRFPFMVLEWLIRNKSLEWAGSKIFSTLLLFAVAQLYRVDVYDHRLLTITVVIAFTSNIILLYFLQQFENVSLPFYRNMPLSFSRRTVNFIVPVFVLCLPELGIIFSRFPHSLSTVLTEFQLGIGLLLLQYGILYTRDRGLKNSVRVLFFTSLLLIVLVLYNIPVLLIGLLSGIIGVALWKRNFYTFEPSVG